MLRLIVYTALAVFTAESLVMLFLEAFGRDLSLPMRVVLDAALLMICVIPTLYFLVFKEMSEQIRLRRKAEQEQIDWNHRLEIEVEERTGRLQRANEDLLVEVQERARAAMALRAALNEAQAGKEQLLAFVNAVRDAMIVVDDEWQVKIVNRAAEAMFGLNSYDLTGRSLKTFLQPWAGDSSVPDDVFSWQEGEQKSFLIPPGATGENGCPVQMRCAGRFDWQGRPVRILTFYCRADRFPEKPINIQLA